MAQTYTKCKPNGLQSCCFFLTLWICDCLFFTTDRVRARVTEETRKKKKKNVCCAFFSSCLQRMTSFNVRKKVVTFTTDVCRLPISSVNSTLFLAGPVYVLSFAPASRLAVCLTLTLSLATPPRGSPPARPCLMLPSRPLFFNRDRLLRLARPWIRSSTAMSFPFSPLIPRFLFTSVSPATCSLQSYVTPFTKFFFFSFRLFSLDQKENM